MEPQKIEYPKDINIKVNHNEAKPLLSLLDSLGYSTIGYSGYIGEKAIYIIIGKEIKLCEINERKSEHYITYEEFKELISTIDIVNTGTFAIEAEYNSFFKNADKLALFKKLKGWEIGELIGASVYGWYYFNSFSTSFNYSKCPFDFKKVTLKNLNLIEQFCLTNNTTNMETTDMTPPEKEIIGYKLVKPEYQEAAEKIMNVYFSMDKRVTSLGCIDRLKTAKVLDLWFEPIYKEEEKEVVLNGNVTLKIKGKQVYHKSENITNYVKEVGQFWENVDKIKKKAGYDMVISDIILSKTGCETKETKITDWYGIYQQINN